jgi:hypothetical protein
VQFKVLVGSKKLILTFFTKEKAYERFRRRGNQTEKQPVPFARPNLAAVKEPSSGIWSLLENGTKPT